MPISKIDFMPYVRLAMYHTWCKDYVADRAIYDHEVIYIDKGKMNIEIQGVKYVAKEGDVVFLTPGVNHKITWAGEDCSQPHIHFDFFHEDDSEFVPVSMKRLEKMSDDEKRHIRPDYLKSRGFFVPHIYHTPNPSRLRNLVMDVISEFTSNDPMRELALEGLMKTLISQIISENMNFRFESESSKLSMIVKFMSENITNNLSLSDLCDTVQLSSWSLNELFNKNYNTTPKKFYDSLRLKYAKNLITNSFKTIEEISEQLSFRNPQTFSRWFKNLTGFYPTVYRDNN